MFNGFQEYFLGGQGLLDARWYLYEEGPNAAAMFSLN